MFRSLPILLACCAAALPCAAQPSNPFFAMDTIARGRPETVVPLLQRLGYRGLAGQAGDAPMAQALAAAGLTFYNGYLTLELTDESPILTEDLRRKIDAMSPSRATLWLALAKVSRSRQALTRQDPAADSLALQQLSNLATYAAAHHVRISLYPHAGCWLEHVEDALRLANRLNQPNLNITFNLCHWLKVEGSSRDPEPLLQAAQPRLDFVTLHGADGGDTQNLSWDRLIQPLGQGTYDVPALLRKLQRVGYTGPIGFQGYGIAGDPAQVLAATMAAWKQMK